MTEQQPQTPYPIGPTRPEPAVVDTTEADTVVVRATGIPAASLARFFETSFHAIGEVVRAEGLRMSGAPFALYPKVPGATIDVEVGMPVETALPSGRSVGAVEVVPSKLPGARVATVSHTGSYDGLAATWGRLMQWVEASGAVPSGAPFWEVYVTMPAPDADPASMRTDLFIPIR